MAVLWVNELDGYLYKLMRDQSYFPPGQFTTTQMAGYGKYARADVFDELIEKVLAKADRKRTWNPTLQKALPELRLAKRQFTDFDYKLIALCHGGAIHTWATDVKTFYYDGRKTEAPNLNLLQHHLDRYFRTNDQRSIGKVLATLEAFPVYEGDSVLESRAALESLSEDIWAQALLEGREIE